MELKLYSTAMNTQYIYASFGYYADMEVLVSLDESVSFVYSTNCTQVSANGTNTNRSCTAEPLNAFTDYNLKDYPATYTNQTLSSAVYDGYTISGWATQANVCFQQEANSSLPWGYF
jgi:hypothetical protein